MSKTSKSKIARREFLKDGATSVIGVGCFSLSLREVLSQAKREGKPLLTERNFNALIPKDPGAFRLRAIEAKHDLRTFIHRHFSLTPGQKRQLDGLSHEDIATIKDAIDLALEKGKGIRVKFIQPPRDGGLRFMPVQQINVPKPLNNIYVDGEIDPLKIVVGVKGKC